MRRPRSRLVNVLLGLVTVLAVTYLVFFAFARPRPPHPFFEGLETPTVLAHQGGDRLWPSNTMYAFERAVELGAHVLELDIHSSRDGELVVIHDDTVDRTTDGSGHVNDITLAQLRELDAGFDWSPERTGEAFPYRGQGLTIPTLTEVFEAFPAKRVNVEIKQLEPSIAADLCSLIREYGRQESVMVGSFHDSALGEFRRECPEVATSAGPNEVRMLYVLSRVYLGNLYRPAADALQVPEYQGSLHVVNRNLVRAAHGKNVQVHVWTPNEVEEFERLLEVGADGIITDRPDRALRVIGNEVQVDLPDGVPN